LIGLEGAEKMMGSTSYRLGIAALVGGLAAGCACAQNSNLPDAQVESNVLRALASAPELSTQNIQSSTVYGVVTLTGNVHDESLRVRAENLAARAVGVKKVVDDLAVGDTPAVAADAGAQGSPDGSAVPNAADNSQPPAGVLQSDGTYAPALPPDQGSQATGMSQSQPGEPPAPPQAAPAYGQNQPPAYNQGYGQQAPPPPADGRRPMYSYAPPQGAPIQGGQQAGHQVTVPAGVTLQIRINRGLDSNHAQAGTTFDGTVLNDVIAGGAVAIPRGAQVQGTVVDAKAAGIFKGQGQLALEITGLTLGGQNYPLTSAVWHREGADKSVTTVNSTLGLSALGAVLGAVAGGGTGAAIGAGVGGATGLAGSAASPSGQIIVPPESVLTFETAQPITVTTVSQQEMQRLAYAAGPPPVQRVVRPRPYPYPYPYYGPAYYGPGYYYGPR
jgi:BON domain